MQLKHLYYSILWVLFFAENKVNSQSSIDPVLASQLQNALDNQFAQYNLKGVVAALSLPNAEIWYGSSGTSDGTDTIKADMLLGIGSNTKTFVATLTMMLVEDGLLKLDDSIYHWVPKNPFIDSTITVKQLLNHTSGLYNYTDHPAIDDSLMLFLDRFWTPEEILATFLDTPYFDKGTDYTYANTNYLILGMIIKVVSGTSISNLLHDRILNPLGLTHTFLDQEDSLVGEIAHAWYDIFDNGDLYDLVYYNIDRTSLYSSMWTAGAMFSTAEDMVKWSKALYTGNLVSDSTLDLMLDFLPGDDYGLGVAQYTISGRELWGHGGDVIYISFLVYSPSDSISIVLLCNDNSMSSSQRKEITQALLDVYIDYSNIIENTTNNEYFRIFPNPSAEQSTIQFTLEKETKIIINLLSVQGVVLEQICNNKYSHGFQQLNWVHTNEVLGSGYYFLEIFYDDKSTYLPFYIIK